METQIGCIHSLDSFGAVDGPGIRYVVFFQGCPLRCIFCHNPDSWTFGQGTPISVDDLTAKIMKLRFFYRKGGVTLSGGEPLAQPKFASALLQKLKKEGIHTAIDTAGSIPLERCREAVDLANLLLLDIKALDSKMCHKMTNSDGANAKKMLDYCQSTNKPVWIRHVLIPGYTLEWARLEELADYISAYTCVQRVELLPFHQMGSHKWKLLRVPYALEGVDPPSPKEIIYAKEIFLSRGLDVC